MVSVCDGLIGEYQLRQRIGNGGMATVYMASHPRFAERVALKVLSPNAGEDDVFVARFEREAQVIASLDHPNIVMVYEAGCAAGMHYIAMEYLPYGTLKERMERFRASSEHMPVTEALEVVRQVALALDYAHKRGLVHRDVKPANILLASGGRYLLTDFGVAFLSSATRLTRDTSQALGTAEYMAPEQVAQQPCDHRLDIYALGVVLYEMLAGAVPFAGDHYMVVMLAHLYHQPASIMAFRKDVPRAVIQLVETAMAKDPGQRFQTAGEMALAVENILAKPQDAGGWMGMPAMTLRRAVVATLIALIVLTAGLRAASALSEQAAGQLSVRVHLATLTADVAIGTVARTGPDERSSAVTQLVTGIRLTVLGKSAPAGQQWWLVELPVDRREAWVEATAVIVNGNVNAVPQVPASK